MTEYCLIDRAFSREWRRSKRYSRNELRWLARRKGLEFRERRDKAQVVEPRTGRVIVNFDAVPAQESAAPSKINQVLATLALGKVMG